MVFPRVMYGCESWTLKKVEHWRTDAFELWCWRRLLRVPWRERRSNQLILKEINHEYSLEGLMLKFHQCEEPTHWKNPDAGKDWGSEEKGVTENEMVEWHHWLNGHEFEDTLGVGKGLGSLVCHSPWDHKQSDTAEWLNNNVVWLMKHIITLLKSFAINEGREMGQQLRWEIKQTVM